MLIRFTDLNFFSLVSSYIWYGYKFAVGAFSGEGLGNWRYGVREMGSAKLRLVVTTTSVRPRTRRIANQIKVKTRISHRSNMNLQCDQWARQHQLWNLHAGAVSSRSALVGRLVCPPWIVSARQRTGCTS